MPATTPKGYPYPVGTDRVADGDNAIQALATMVDTAAGVLASGLVGIPALGAQTVAVTFPVGRFTVAPLVALTSNATASTSNPVSLGAVSVTTAGFTVSANRASGGAYSVYWIAHQGV
jgi:hypothetical protein